MLIPADWDSSEGLAGLDMEPMLQIATSNASTEDCNVREADLFDSLHIEDMDESKNGGPNYLQMWREFRHLTQEELAEAVGTTASVISLLEAGERGLSAKWLRKFSIPLKARPGWLLDFDPHYVNNDLLETWGEIPEGERPRALKVLKSFSTGTDG